MEYVAMNGISYLSLDDELLALMFEAGFSQLNLALVSSDRTVRETTKRPHTLEAYLKVVNKGDALGFKIVSYQILGLPNESFSRDDIYTLFVTTRIINFLKGLPITETVSLGDLMTHSWPDSRTRIGFALLRQLITTGILSAWTKNGPVENKRFSSELCQRVLEQAGEVSVRSGGKI